MLKIITTVRDDPESVTVHLYGQFTGEYVAEVEKALSGRGSNNHRVTLDLANVTLVDRAGMMFLYGVKSGNVAVENTPSYVTRWIEQEGRRGSAHSEPS
jgi:anti-anti-sigma regulatory factor